MNQYMIIIGAFTTKEKAISYAKQLEKDGHPSFIISNNDNENMEVVEKTTKQLYDEVMKLGLNGEERKKYLGKRFDEVQKYINKKHG